MEYAKLPGLTPDGTMYWNEEMGTVEAVLPPGGYKTAHGPGLLELETGICCASGSQVPLRATRM